MAPTARPPTIQPQWTIAQWRDYYQRVPRGTSLAIAVCREQVATFATWKGGESQDVFVFPLAAWNTQGHASGVLRSCYVRVISVRKENPVHYVDMYYQRSSGLPQDLLEKYKSFLHLWFATKGLLTRKAQTEWTRRQVVFSARHGIVEQKKTPQNGAKVALP